MMGPQGGRGDGNQTATTHLQRRVQSASGARGLDWAEDGSPSMPRAAPQARCAEPLEGGVGYARKQRLQWRRARAAGRAAHRRVGAAGGAALVGVGDSKKSCLALGREQKRALVAQLRVEYPVAVICRILQLPRSGVDTRDQ